MLIFKMMQHENLLIPINFLSMKFSKFPPLPEIKPIVPTWFETRIPEVGVCPPLTAGSLPRSPGNLLLNQSVKIPISTKNAPTFHLNTPTGEFLPLAFQKKVDRRHIY